MRATYIRTQGVRHMFAALDLGKDRMYGHVKKRKRRGEFLKTQGEWMAACGTGSCSFLVMVAADQYDALWTFAAGHERDPSVGQGLDRLPVD